MKLLLWKHAHGDKSLKIYNSSAIIVSTLAYILVSMAFCMYYVAIFPRMFTVDISAAAPACPFLLSPDILKLQTILKWLYLSGKISLVTFKSVWCFETIWYKKPLDVTNEGVSEDGWFNLCLPVFTKNLDPKTLDIFSCPSLLSMRLNYCFKVFGIDGQ